MRKTFKRMLVVAGVAALLLPTAAMAGWDQTELHTDQEDHDELININTAGPHPYGDFGYGMESAIGYDRFGDGNATLLTNRMNNAWGGAPWNTLPCPIQLADTTAPFTLEEALGNCPVNSDPDSGQTDAGWDATDVELYGPILDDLYTSMSETASIDTVNTTAFKKVDQVMDILFYRANTVAEAWGVDGWQEQNTGTTWYGGFGIDQTLDQDVADVEGTASNPVTVPFGQELWAYDHIAQTFYQDFRLFDKGNQTQQLLDENGTVARTRHGLFFFGKCRGTGDCVLQLDETNEGLDSEFTLDPEDFGFFDQWVIQSMKDSYNVPLNAENFVSDATLAQSYSSWMVLGAPGSLCEEINDLGQCKYEYNKGAHAVDKSIIAAPSDHQTGDP